MQNIIDIHFNIPILPCRFTAEEQFRNLERLVVLQDLEARVYSDMYDLFRMVSKTTMAHMGSIASDEEYGMLKCVENFTMMISEQNYMFQITTKFVIIEE